MLKRKNVKGKVKVTFVLPEDHPHAANTSVVGDFNGWDPEANPLRRRSNQTYSTSVTLDKDGCYRFRYRAAGDIWFNEPDADRHEHNEYGSQDDLLLT